MSGIDFNFEEAFSADSLEKLVNDQIRKWINNYIDSKFREIYERLSILEKNFNAAPLDALLESNEQYFAEIKPTIEHIERFEKSIYTELKRLQKNGTIKIRR